LKDLRFRCSRRRTNRFSDHGEGRDARDAVAAGGGVGEGGKALQSFRLSCCGLGVG
jgi:hypothetical protein